MRRTILMVALIALVRGADPLAAQLGELQGWVRTTTGRGIPAALVTLAVPADTVPLRTTEADALGRFRFRGVAPGAYELRAGSIGFAPSAVEVVVQADSVNTAQLILEEAAVDLPGVAVVVDRARASFETEAAATRRELSGAELKRIPGVAEADVLRAVEVLPGVVSTSDYSSAFNVRGGSADQNLILLDGVPVYNPFHLGGLFSVFNADVVARAELLAGGFPAQYGGRVASVLSVESDASGLGTDVDAGMSVLATRIALGADLPGALTGALGLRNGRARVSVRRSYFDQLLAPFVEFPYHLIDGQAYLEAWTDGGRRVSLTAYSGRDVLDLARSEDFPLRIRWTWGNDLAGARFTVPLAQGRTLELNAGFSRFATSILFPDFNDTDLRSEVRQLLLRGDLELPVGDALRIRTGLHGDYLSYDNLFASGGTEFAAGAAQGWLGAAYAQANWRGGNWLVEVGARADAWLPRRSDDVVVVSPRIGVKRFFRAGETAIKLGLGRYSQFIHSLRDEELPIGIDVWVLSGARAPHTVSNQLQLGLESYLGGGWFAAIEAYSRWFDGVVTNNFAEDPNTDTDDLIGGTGLSYGSDLLVQRDRGRVRPTVSISWLRAWREFEDPSLGVSSPLALRYPPIFDRRVDVELLLQAQLPRGVEAGFRWNYGSGLPYTRALAGFRTFTYNMLDRGRLHDDESDIGDLIAIVLGPRNAERYPAYHRLDVSFRKTYRKRWGRLTPHLDLLNVYDRRNVLFYFYEYDRSPAVRSGVSMFPFLPTIGLEVSF